MKTFIVENSASGHVFGAYQGHDADEAIAAMMREAGSDEEPDASLTATEIEPSVEDQILSAGEEFLPECARRVRDGGEPTREYFAWLAGQISQMSAEG